MNDYSILYLYNSNKAGLQSGACKRKPPRTLQPSAAIIWIILVYSAFWMSCTICRHMAASLRPSSAQVSKP